MAEAPLPRHTTQRARRSTRPAHLPSAHRWIRQAKWILCRDATTATEFAASPLDDPVRRAQEDGARHLRYPDSEWSERDEKHGRFRTLRAIITPIPPPEELLSVLFDFQAGRRLSLDPGGRLRHHRECRGPHGDPGWLHGLQLADQRFLVEATFWSLTGDPRVRVLEPEVSRRIYPDHPHFYGEDIVCPVFPPDRTWTWANPVTAYLNHVAGWLLCSAVWIETSRISKGLWIGQDTTHDGRVLLRIVPRSAPCPTCASGQPFGRCCRPRLARMHAKPWYQPLFERRHR
jgi:hypothetical protein